MKVGFNIHSWLENNHLSLTNILSGHKQLCYEEVFIDCVFTTINFIAT